MWMNLASGQIRSSRSKSRWTIARQTLAITLTLLFEEAVNQPRVIKSRRDHQLRLLKRTIIAQIFVMSADRASRLPRATVQR